MAGSSEALLSGQKPPFRLLVRAVDAKTGKRVAHINFAISEAFVVRFAGGCDLSHGSTQKEVMPKEVRQCKRLEVKSALEIS